MKLNLSWLLLACSLTFIACDDSGGDDDAGTEMAGTEMAGTEMAGTEMAGTEMAGTEMAGTEMAGTEMAGTEMAGSMTGGSMTGICNEVVEVGATCDPSNDCCARGSICNQTSETEGQCVRLCEIPEEGDPVGCEARELCVEDGEQGEDGITPGFCLPSDNCEPGNENLACGEGEFHCLRVQNITLCIGDLAEARAEDPSLIVGEGQPCDVFNETTPTYCEPGLTCESNGTERVCRKACGADTDCSEGETCLDYTDVTDGLNYKFCSPRCELATPDCGDTGACVITDILNDVAYGTCQEVGAENIAATGEACNIFDSDQPLVFCGAGNSCEFNGVNSVCTAICNAETMCAEGETCIDATTRYNEAFQYNFCTTPCDPLAQDCSPTASEDLNDNGVLDTEDTNGNGILDESEDTNENGVLDTEDTNGNGMLDEGEDTNENGVLDTEDTNGNGMLDESEDTNGNGVLDTEDTNGNGMLDLGTVRACAFSGVIDSAPTGTCVSEPASGEGQNTDACVSGPNDAYWGDCAANNVCFIEDETTGAGSCGSFCADGRSDLCTGEYQACVDSAIDGLGLCAGACDIYSGNGCEDGSSCLFSNEGNNAEGNVAATGFCEPNEDAGQVGLEETCVMGELDVGDGETFEYPFLNNCPPGHICIGVAQGQPPICLQMCAQGAAENTCPDGLTCQGLFQSIESVGVCFQ